MDAKSVIERIKNLKEFIIEYELPEDFIFSGNIPFDLFISENQITAKVLASSQKEADRIVREYFTV